MRKIPAVLKPPHHQYNGNLLWNVANVVGKENEISESLDQFRNLGYWASPFPEGDGVTFSDETKSKGIDELFEDVTRCFTWLVVSLDLEGIDKAAPKRSPMPTLGYEDTVRLQKSLAAITQLEDAIELFLAGNRLSSITLAAAADGILSGLLKQRGLTSAAENTWSHIEEVRKTTGLEFAGDRTKKDAFNEWNWHQNRLKHHDERDDEFIDINIFDHAYYAINRALADADLLNLEVCNRPAFEIWMFENVFT